MTGHLVRLRLCWSSPSSLPLVAAIVAAPAPSTSTVGPRPTRHRDTAPNIASSTRGAQTKSSRRFCPAFCQLLDFCTGKPIFHFSDPYLRSVMLLEPSLSRSALAGLGSAPLSAQARAARYSCLTLLSPM